MFLSEPSATQADINFRVFGFPVRVSPYFWVTTVLLSSGFSDQLDPQRTLIWVAVVFVSILIHELGHAVLQRHFGGRPWITLYGLGGLASCSDCDRRPRSQILISLAGPAAGFLLAGLVIAILFAMGHIALFRLYWIPIMFRGFASEPVNELIADLLRVNILWGLINLLPIFPLDGGQISRQLFSLWNSRTGELQSLQLSCGVAALVAAYGLINQDWYIGIMFGVLAYSSFQAIQSIRYPWR